MRLGGGSHKTRGSPRPPARIFKVYIEALSGFSHVFSPGGLSNILLSQGFVLQAMGMVGRRGGGEEPTIDWLVLGQRSSSRSGVNWQSHPPHDLLQHSSENATYPWIVIFYLYTSQKTKLTSDTHCSLNWTSHTNVWNINFISKAFDSCFRSYDQSLYFKMMWPEDTIKIWTFHSFNKYLSIYKCQALEIQAKQVDPCSHRAYILAGGQY